jgi:hypothetical protein
MAVYCFTQLIQPGKRDDARAIFEEIRTSRRDEYEASRKRLDIREERVWFQSLPDAEMAVVYWEGDDPRGALERFASSDDPFDEWLKERGREVYHFEPGQTLEEDEEVFASSSGAVSGVTDTVGGVTDAVRGLRIISWEAAKRSGSARKGRVANTGSTQTIGPGRKAPPALLLALIHRSAWNRLSQKFVSRSGHLAYMICFVLVLRSDLSSSRVPSGTSPLPRALPGFSVAPSADPGPPGPVPDSTSP